MKRTFSTLKRIIFRFTAIVGLVNVVWLSIGVSYSLLVVTAELCGARVLGSGSVWENWSSTLAHAYLSFPVWLIVVAGVCTFIGFSWLATNWSSFRAKYWDDPVHKNPAPKDDYALKFGEVRNK